MASETDREEDGQERGTTQREKAGTAGNGEAGGNIEAAGCSTGRVTPEALVQLLIERNMTLSTCESCTGGLLAAMITSVPGVSAVYAGGLVTYTVKTKHAIAGVSKKLLRKEGAVSRKTARHMAKNTARRLATDCALSVTGNAGPDPSEGKPVGLVYLGCTVDEQTEVAKYQFSGDRQQIRQQAAEEAIRLLYERLSAMPAETDTE